MPKNYYLILGVNADASSEDIKAAFRRRAMELHPDQSGLRFRDGSGMGCISPQMRHPCRLCGKDIPGKPEREAFELWSCSFRGGRQLPGQVAFSALAKR